MPQTFTLPNLYAKWPFERTLHPSHKSISTASSEWAKSFYGFDEDAHSLFDCWDPPLMASLMYSRTDPVHFRLASDMIFCSFVLDECIDGWSGAQAREMLTRLMGILKDPSKPLPGEQTIIEKMMASFWSRTLEFACRSSIDRFVKSTISSLAATCMEAEDRERGRVRSIEEYLPLRRSTNGTKACFDFLLLSVDVPEDVISHPCIETLTWSAVEMVILSNDIYSWNYERSKGLDNHNMVTVVIAELGLDIQDAIDYVGDMYHQATATFVENMTDIPSFSEKIDPIVSEYVLGLATWVTGFLEWSFESERYFGRKGQEIKSTRIVELVPRLLDE